MDRATFFKHYELLADQPDALAKMRQLVLELAVRGKLVLQNPKDEPALLLFEKIQEARTASAKARWAGKLNNFEHTDQNEASYALPASWRWCRLDSLCIQITDGTHFTPTYVHRGVPFLSVKDVTRGKIDLSGVKYISQEEHEALTKRCKPQYLDILFTKVGTTGIARVIDTRKEFSIFVSLALLKFPQEFVDPYFLELVLNSPLVRQQSADNTQGVGNKNLVLKSIKGFVVPLSPLAEQRRIVAKVDELTALCDELEKRQQAWREARTKLLHSALHHLQTAREPKEFAIAWQRVRDNFHVLHQTPESIPELRAIILRMAVEGRLGTQHPQDDSAAAFVEKCARIKRQMIQQKLVSSGPDLLSAETKEPPFIIPKSWMWIRFGTLIESMTNGIYKHETSYSEDGIGCLRMYNIKGGRINFDNLKRMRLDEHEFQQYKLEEGDLLVNRVNSRELVGKAAVIESLPEPLVFESKNIRVRLLEKNYLPRYANLLFQTHSIRSVFEGGAKQTCGQASVNQPQVANLLIGIPPLAEQKRIVGRVEELMHLCDLLEAQLNQSRTLGAHLLESTIHHVLNPNGKG